MEQLNTRVRETGIAHDLFSDPATHGAALARRPRPAHHLGAEEWRALERALMQRARLFEAILADLYGPQQLLAIGRHSRISSSSATPPFCAPATASAAGQGLSSSSLPSTLRAGPTARWRVIDTHTETPAGIGYALANRMVHTNVAGDMFAACKALRLAPFFQQLQAALARRANRADPPIALLTPGPRHNDFFSHAYLARYLGLLLVEGGDLRVAGDRVSLKTLDGLMPIDLIVRCVAGAVADPLELDASGFAGPVGLLQAVRQQPDLVANALGSALAENRGLERLPAAVSPRRCWARSCSSPTARAGGSAMPPTAQSRPRQPRPHGHPPGARGHGAARPRHRRASIPPRLSADRARRRCCEEIELRGATLVAEEKIGFGTTPSLTPAGLVPKPYALRLFVAADQPTASPSCRAAWP